MIPSKRQGQAEKDAVLKSLATNRVFQAFKQRAVARRLSPGAQMTDWKPIDTVPTDGTTIELRGIFRAHYAPGTGYPMLPDNWRPDTPHTQWCLTEWREVPEKLLPPAKDSMEK